MSTNKSHFWYNKRQRNGILFLATFLLLFQFVLWFVDFSNKKPLKIEPTQIARMQKTIDSLKHIEIENRKPRIYPFNPSFLTDYKAYKLGLSTKEFDKLAKFRASGKYINSPTQFKQVTQIPESLFQKLKPYFKFPDWLTKKKEVYKPSNIISKDLNLTTVEDLIKINGIGNILANRIIKFRTSLNGFQTKEQVQKIYGLKTEVVSELLKYYPLSEKNTTSTPIHITCINSATANDLKKINGIGDKLSNRIIKYRNKLKGFLFMDQLKEVYGLKPEVIQNVKKYFKVINKPKIKKISINEASFKEILKIPFIDYELTKKIMNYRDEFAEFQDLNELKKIDGFPLDKYDRIILYLTTDYLDEK